MRLKKDHSDYRSSGLWSKYNPKEHGFKRKKDTKRWCKGKEGREHDWTEYHPKRYLFGDREHMSEPPKPTDRWDIWFLERYCVNCQKVDSNFAEVI